MNWNEQTLCFACGGETLLAIVTLPEAPRPTSFVIVVGGPQYRAGSHRQFVSLARHLASSGHAVLRFDVRGMGDATGPRRSFEQIGADIGAAIDALAAAVPAQQRVVLWGLCDGASAALLYLHEQRDERVAGLVLLNPWVRSPASDAKTRVKHYYGQRLRERAFWIKLASGRVAATAIADLWRNLRTARRAATAVEDASFQQRMARAWAAFRGPVLLMLSEHDHTAAEFIEFTAAAPDWQAAFAANAPERVQLVGADHTCSTRCAREAAERVARDWAAQRLEALS